MRTIIDPIEFWKGAVPSEDGSMMVELDGTLSAAETLWRMVLAMALKDNAWCIQYDVNHPARLIYVTEWQVYALVPPPDDMADLLVRAIDRITRPTSIAGRFQAATRSVWPGRVTRSFWVRHGDDVVPWVASLPRRAADGPVVVFRETYPGPDPSIPWDRTASGSKDQGMSSDTATNTAGNSASDSESPTRSVRTST